MNIYVGNLHYNVDEEDLRGIFEEYGEVNSVKLITDKFTNKSKGFAFVEMSSNESDQAAIAALNEARERTNDDRKKFSKGPQSNFRRNERYN